MAWGGTFRRGWPVSIVDRSRTERTAKVTSGTGRRRRAFRNMPPSNLRRRKRKKYRPGAFSGASRPHERGAKPLHHRPAPRDGNAAGVSGRIAEGALYSSVEKERIPEVSTWTE